MRFPPSTSACPQADMRRPGEPLPCRRSRPALSSRIPDIWFPRPDEISRRREVDDRIQYGADNDADLANQRSARETRRHVPVSGRNRRRRNHLQRHRRLCLDRRGGYLPRKRAQWGPTHRWNDRSAGFPWRGIRRVLFPELRGDALPLWEGPGPVGHPTSSPGGPMRFSRCSFYSIHGVKT